MFHKGSYRIGYYVGITAVAIMWYFTDSVEKMTFYHYFFVAMVIVVINLLGRYIARWLYHG